MSVLPIDTIELTQRERELGAIIHAYNEVAERLKESHEKLQGEVRRLREELERKNRQLRRRERLAALGELAAGVAHEIRNPLSAIQLLASLLQRDLQDRPKSRESVEKIIRSVSTLGAIVNDILQFGRPADPSPSAVELAAIVQETVELAAPKAEETGVAIHVLEDVADIEMFTDGAMLGRALLNLVRNAIEATAEARMSTAGRRDAARLMPGGVVEIGARRGPGDRVVITVSDEGSGVPSDAMDRIFNPFFTTKGDGTGLGLAIVHQIAETLGGLVQVANRPTGGAMFSLSLPRVMADGTAERRTA